MKLKTRLGKLKRTHKLEGSTYPNAKAELLRRLERADPQTRARILEAVAEARL